MIQAIEYCCATTSSTDTLASLMVDHRENEPETAREVKLALYNLGESPDDALTVPTQHTQGNAMIHQFR